MGTEPMNVNLDPLKQWYCDTCHQVIARPVDGWVEWMYTKEEPSRAGRQVAGIRIVHQASASPRQRGGSDCRYPRGTQVGGTALQELLGPTGLGVLLGMLTKGEVADTYNWADIVRRLHIPHYEEARQYWREAEEDGFFAGVDLDEYYRQERLVVLVDTYGG